MEYKELQRELMNKAFQLFPDISKKSQTPTILNALKDRYGMRIEINFDLSQNFLCRDKITTYTFPDIGESSTIKTSNSLNHRQTRCIELPLQIWAVETAMKHYGVKAVEKLENTRVFKVGKWTIQRKLYNEAPVNSIVKVIDNRSIILKGTDTEATLMTFSDVEATKISRLKLETVYYK